MIQLRDYQIEDDRAIDAAFARGIHRQVVNQATGLGKTVLASHRIAKTAGRALFLAPLKEVVLQSYNEVKEMVPHRPVGVVYGDRKEYHADVVVASVDTARSDRHLAKLAMKGKFDTIIVDECHLKLDGYKKIVDALSHERSLVLGLSATPVRADGRGLDAVFQEITVSRDLLWGMEFRHLAPLKVKHIYVDMDLNKVPSLGGDFKARALASYMAAANYMEHFADDWFAHAADRRTAVFVPRVQDAYELAEFMRVRGVAAAALDGGGGYEVLDDKGQKRRRPGMAPEQRRQVLADFQSGKLQMLVNVACLIAGWNCPPVNCIAWLRPTKSYAMLWQGIGRGTRLSPATGKTDCLVLDIVGAVECNKLQQIEDILGVEKVREGEDVLQAKKRGEVEAAEREQKEAEERERLEAEHRVREIAILRQQEAKAAWQAKVFRPESVAEFIWQPALDGTDKLSVKINQTYVWFDLRPMAGRAAWLARVSGGGDLREFSEKWSCIKSTAAEARGLCEDYARRLIKANVTSWRDEPATEKQKDNLRKFRIGFSARITKGMASDLLEEFFRVSRERAAAKKERVRA